MSSITVAEFLLSIISTLLLTSSVISGLADHESRAGNIRSLENVIFPQTAKLVSGDAQAGGWFGTSAAIDGDIALVGAYEEGGTAPNAPGAAYIFQRNQGGLNNWGRVKRLFPNEEVYAFGESVDVDENTMVVGAPLDTDMGFYSGSAFIFEREYGGPDNWGQFKKLIASDGAAGDQFGISVAISGNVIIVGAYNNDGGGGEGSGIAYIFDRNQGGINNWGEVAKLIASDGAAFDRFGYSVDISGDTAVVGAYSDDDNGDASGSAYVYGRDQGGINNWGEVAKLTAKDGATDDRFGLAVGIDGDSIIVGAFADDVAGADSGSAYIFERNQGGPDSWGESVKITPSDASSGEWFGRTVAIHGDNAIVGANLSDANGSDSGSAYVFHRYLGGQNAWGELEKVTAADSAAGDTFGDSVAISSGTLVVGAHGDDDYGDSSGSAYVFDLANILNDDFDDATLISTTPFSSAQNVFGATESPDDPPIPCFSGQAYRSVWFRYTPPENGSLAVDTFGSGYDTVLAVWSGVRTDLVNAGCNDNSGGLQSRVNIIVTAGKTYHIEIAGADLSAFGPLSLAVEFTPISRVFLPVNVRNYISYFDGPWEQEDNDSIYQANGSLRSGIDYYGSHNDENDFYSIYLESGGNLEVDLISNHTIKDKQGNSVVQVQLFYGSRENMVDYRYGTVAHINHIGQSGLYYVRVVTVPQYLDSNKQYTLSVTYP